MNTQLKHKENIQDKMFEIEKSYMKKEELIMLLQNLDFVAVKELNIDVITGFIVDEDKVKTLSYELKVDRY